MQGNKINDIEKRLDLLEKKYQSIEDQLKSTIGKIDSLLNAPKIELKDGIDVSDINRLLAQLKKEIEDDFSKKCDFLKLQGDVSKLGDNIDVTAKQTNKNEDDIDKLRRLLSTLEKELKSKVNSVDFDNIIRNLQNALQNINLGNGVPVQFDAMLSAKDQDLIKDLAEKYGVMEDQMKLILSELAQMKSKMGKIEIDLEELRKLSKNQDIILQIVQRITNIELKLQSLPASTKIVESDINGAAVNDLKNAMQALRNDLDKLRSELLQMIKDLQNQINRKADTDALSVLENQLIERMDAIVNALTKKLADKNDTKKALKLLEKQIKALYDMLLAKGSHGEAEDAMFTKKPLGGFSCASCEKGLVNLQGQIAEYYPWNKMPARDPSERIAKVGQGFSKMLGMLRPENIQKMQIGRRMVETYDGDDQMDNIDTPSKTGTGFYNAAAINAQQQMSNRPLSANAFPTIPSHKFGRS